MKTVLQICDNNIRGGIFRVISCISECFRNDKEINVYTTSKQSAVEFNKLVPETFIMPENQFNRFFFFLSNRNKFDLIHFHGFNIMFFFIVLLLRKKVVYTNHGLLGTGRSLRHYEYFKRAFIKIFLRYFTDCIVNVSKYAQKKIIEEYGIDYSKSIIIYNHTDWEHKELLEFNKGKPVRLGYHGRFAEVKKIERILNVAYKLKKTIDVKVCLLGEGPLREKYLSLANDLNIDIEISEYSMSPQEKIRGFDFVIVSSSVEYFGLSVIEGIISGKITFIFKNSGGCTEIFENGFEWFICRDEDEMVDKIIYCLNNYLSIKGLFLELQSKTFERFSKNIFYSGYKEIYRKVLNYQN